MSRHIATGIDIGTFTVKVIVAEGVFENGHFVPRIIGTGTAESRGVERGYITNPEEASRSIRTAVARAEKMAGTKIKSAYVAFGGVGLTSLTTSASIAISRADLEITSRDLKLVTEAAEAAIPTSALLNRKILNTVPIEYKMDGKVVWGRTEGLKAQKLEVKALFITCLEHHLADLIKSVETAGVEVVDVVAAPVASSLVTLSKKEKKAGCLLADFGAETLSTIIFESGNIISLEIFPVGGTDITNDLALGLKIPLDEAERIKLGGIPRGTFPKKRQDDIIAVRLADSFEMVEDHLKKIGRDSLLPAGVVLTGGTAGLTGIRASVENTLGLPVQVAEIYFGNGEKNKTRDNIWAIACGLAIFSFSGESVGLGSGDSFLSSFNKNLRNSLRKSGEWISQFLP